MKVLLISKLEEKQVPLLGKKKTPFSLGNKSLFLPNQNPLSVHTQGGRPESHGGFNSPKDSALHLLRAPVLPGLLWWEMAELMSEN